MKYYCFFFLVHEAKNHFFGRENGVCKHSVKGFYSVIQLHIFMLNLLIFTIIILKVLSIMIFDWLVNTVSKAMFTCIQNNFYEKIQWY